MSKVIVISTSLRAKSNSDILTEQLIAGAKDAGHEVEHISMEGLWNKGRKIGVILFVLVMLVSVTACGQTETTKESQAGLQETEPVTLTASEDAETVNEAGEVTTESEVDSIGTSLPRNDIQTTTEAGDIVLYSGDQIVVFYGSNSWAYTRLGRITDKNEDELAKMLGKEDVTISIDSE